MGRNVTLARKGPDPRHIVRWGVFWRASTRALTYLLEPARRASRADLDHIVRWSIFRSASYRALAHFPKRALPCAESFFLGRALSFVRLPLTSQFYLCKPSWR